MTSIDAKIVLLGSQGVGKTSLLRRYLTNAFTPASTPSTIGASFLTKRVHDSDSNTTVRLQIWDTAGQERFRSISKLYYRGANAVLLCYDITDEESFREMGTWLQELKGMVTGTEGGENVLVHVVGTKSDLVQEDPSRRRVPFERCIAYVAENLYPEQAASSVAGGSGTPPATAAGARAQSPGSKRSSGFWGQEVGWDTCHEISAKDGEGVEEVFRVLTRKLVEQRSRRVEGEGSGEAGALGALESRLGEADGRGSFKVGMGDRRKSWLGMGGPPMLGPGALSREGVGSEEEERAERRSRCCS
ncbi:MAG: hypothetical protein M1824_003902 [Vezdaea acicularis]|nr:MAG: hypothetical protein M1824_003902 [Vezdaea acicularis]